MHKDQDFLALEDQLRSSHISSFLIFLSFGSYLSQLSIYSELKEALTRPKGNREIGCLIQERDIEHASPIAKVYLVDYRAATLLFYRVK